MLITSLTVESDKNTVTTLHASEQDAIDTIDENYLTDEDRDELVGQAVGTEARSFSESVIEYATGRMGLIVHIDTHDITYLLPVALRRFGETFNDGMTAHDVGGHFTCTEADALVDALDALGAEDAANAWREGHAAHDEEGDSHYEEPDGAPREQSEVTTPPEVYLSED